MKALNFNQCDGAMWSDDGVVAGYGLLWEQTGKVDVDVDVVVMLRCLSFDGCRGRLSFAVGSKPRGESRSPSNFTSWQSTPTSTKHLTINSLSLAYTTRCKSHQGRQSQSYLSSHRNEISTARL
jgi:hypothetical protein